MKKILSAFIVLSLCSFTYTDAVRKIGPGREGPGGAVRMLNLVKKLTTNLKPDAKTKALQDFVYGQLGHFDLDRIYQSSYFDTLPDGYRGIKFIGTEKKNHFQIRHTSQKYDSVRLKKFGDYIELFALKKKKDPKTGRKSFSAYSKQRVFSGPYSNRNLLAFGTAALRVLDPYNIKRLPKGKLEYFKNTKGDSEKVLLNFSRSFPELSSVLDRLFILESAATVKTYNKRKYTHMKMVVSLREDNVKTMFPRIAKYLKKIRKLFAVDYRYLNRQGHTFIKLSSASRVKNFFRLEFLTARGMLIPFKTIEEPVFKEQFSMERVRNYHFTIISNSLFNVHGLKFSNRGTRVSGHYQTGRRKARLVLKMKDYKKTKISGRFYSIIPPWLIDIFIPSNLDSHINNFARLMEKANNGEGSYMDFRWDFTRRNRTIASLKTSSEFLDNSFVRFSLKVNDRTFIPKESTVSEIDRLVILLTDSLINDLGKIRR